MTINVETPVTENSLFQELVKTNASPIVPTEHESLERKAIRPDMNIDDLIPKSLKIASGELEKQQTKKESKSKTREVDTSINEYDIIDPKLKVETKADLEEELDSDDIDKLIDSKILPKETKEELEDEEEKPSWYQNDKYKMLLNKVSISGINHKELDEVIQDTLDSKILDTSNYTKKVENEFAQTKQQLDLDRKEIARLKQIEKAAHFDVLPETQKEFIEPMTAAAIEIQKVLNFNGADVGLNKLLNAKDRIDFNNLLKDELLTDKDINTLTNHWRNYKELELRYNNSKEHAKTDLTKYLKAEIPEKEVIRVMTDSLNEFITSNDKFSYIKEALKDDLSKSPDVTEVIGNAQNNFKTLLQSYGNPNDHVHNEQWLSGLAKFLLNAEHAKNIEKKYYGLEEKYKEAIADRDKLAKAYKQLKSSGVGIKGFNGTNFKSNGTQVNGKIQKDDDADNFKKFLKRGMNINDLLES